MSTDWHKEWIKSQIELEELKLHLNRAKAEYRKTITELEAEIKYLKGCAK